MCRALKELVFRAGAYQPPVIRGCHAGRGQEHAGSDIGRTGRHRSWRRMKPRPPGGAQHWNAKGIAQAR